LRSGTELLVIGDAPIKAAPAGLRQVEIGINHFRLRRCDARRPVPHRPELAPALRNGNRRKQQINGWAIIVSHERGQVSEHPTKGAEAHSCRCNLATDFQIFGCTNGVMLF
jgi:hypothetical protein